MLSRELANSQYAVSNNIKQFDNRTKITTLLGVKYYIVNAKHKVAAPYGFTPLKTIRDKQAGVAAVIYQNQYNLGFSAFYDTYLPASKYNRLSPLEKEDSLINHAALAKSPNGYHIALGHERKIENNTNYTILDPNKLLKSAHKIVAKKAGQFIKLSVNQITDSELYVLIKNLYYHPPKGGSGAAFSITASRRGISKKEVQQNKTTDPWYFQNHYFLLNLGYAKTYSGPIKITFGKKGTYTFSKLQVLAVSMRDYRASITKLIQDNMKITKYTDNSIEGVISNAKDGILQISTPYSKGWAAYVDGRKTGVIKVNTAFIGAPLKAGTHHVKFVYTTPYLKAGAVVSLIGLIACILLAVFQRRKSRQQRQIRLPEDV